MSDFQYIFQWWFLLCIIGIVYLPITTRFFPLFSDRGYALSKIFGTAITAYLVFVLGVTQILPFTFLSSLLAILFPTAVFFIVQYFRQKNAFSLFLLSLKPKWKLFLIEEVIFFLALWFWSYVRSFSPDIHGLEKYMDFGFVNSILRSDFFPPKDMWFTPFSINYYYFGHFVTAVLTKLSGIPSFITYNLMIATLFALSFSASFSIATTLFATFAQNIKRFFVKLIVAGLLSAALVTLAGNLHVIYTFFKPYQNENPVPPWNLAFAPTEFHNSYWYPNATRFIFNTIHEFPIYSWVVADLHGHVLDIPFVLLTIALLLSLFLNVSVLQPNEEKKEKKHRSSAKKNIHTIKSWFFGLPFTVYHVFTVSFMLSVMYMTNAWDGLIYLMLTGLVVLFISFKLSFSSNSKTGIKYYVSSIMNKKFLIHATSYMLLIFAGFTLFSLPFSLHFNPSAIVSGIGVLCAPKFLTDMGSLGPILFEKDHCQKSPLWQMVILYGFFYFFVISFVIFLKRSKKFFASDGFVLILTLLATMLIIIPEFLYMKDIYPAHYRANTMFKLVFQSFIMLSLVSGYVFMRILTSLQFRMYSKTKKVLVSCYMLLATGLIILVMQYPKLATQSYYGDLKNYKGLDGTKYLQQLYPTDYEAINWINDNVKGQPVILESQGDSYTDHARVSSNTGLPTILGWTVHEWLWRGTYDIPAPRITEVQTLYESPDIAATKQLIDNYKIQYIFFGNMEREKYPNINEKKFEQLGTIVFSKGNTKIYKLK